MLDPATASAARQRWTALCTAALFGFGWYCLAGEVGLSPSDQGYLWYGTWRTSLGELPMRDFQAYDPGRYYATAALQRVTGDGVLGMRRALAIVQAIGVFFGLLAARRATHRAWPLVPIGIVLGTWLVPSHKAFEGAISLVGTWVAILLLERPTRGRHFGAGVCAGLGAVLGRNHGLYLFIAFAFLLAWSAFRRRDPDWMQKSLAFGAGVAGGYAPMLALFVFAPGFWQAFLESALEIFRVGLNIEEPWLWPWRAELAGLPPHLAVIRIAQVVMYSLPVLALPIGAILFLRARSERLAEHALLGAATVLGAVYLHHAAVRSDLNHLAQALQPTLLAALALLALAGLARRRLAGALAVGLAASALLALAEYGWIGAARARLSGVDLVAVDVAGERLYMDPRAADYYGRLQAALGQRFQPDDVVFFAPSLPGFYALFRRASPTRTTFFFDPRPPEALQHSIVDDLAGVDWALVLDEPIAGREEFRFRTSYAIVWAFLEANFERAPTPRLPANHVLLRRRR